MVTPFYENLLCGGTQCLHWLRKPLRGGAPMFLCVCSVYRLGCVCGSRMSIWVSPQSLSTLFWGTSSLNEVRAHSFRQYLTSQQTTGIHAPVSFFPALRLQNYISIPSSFLESLESEPRPSFFYSKHFLATSQAPTPFISTHPLVTSKRACHSSQGPDTWKWYGRRGFPSRTIMHHCGSCLKYQGVLSGWWCIWRKQSHSRQQERKDEVSKNKQQSTVFN